MEPIPQRSRLELLALAGQYRLLLCRFLQHLTQPMDNIVCWPKADNIIPFYVLSKGFVMRVEDCDSADIAGFAQPLTRNYRDLPQ